LGDIRFKGRFTGFIYDFVAYGDFYTRLGYVRTDLNMKLDGKEAFSGNLEMKQFQLGKLLDIPELGKLSFSGKVEGNGFSLETMEVKVEADVSEFELAEYSYRNIRVNGLLKEEFFEGDMEVKDPNLELTFNGK